MPQTYMKHQYLHSRPWNKPFYDKLIYKTDWIKNQMQSRLLAPMGINKGGIMIQNWNKVLNISSLYL